MTNKITKKRVPIPTPNNLILLPVDMESLATSEENEQSSNGIIIPKSAGRIEALAAGKVVYANTGNSPQWYGPGEVVIYRKGFEVNLTIDSETYIVMDLKNVVAVIIDGESDRIQQSERTVLNG